MYPLQSKKLWDETTANLEEVYVHTEARELAFRLLHHLTGYNKTDLLLNKEIQDFNVDFFNNGIQKLLKETPLQYIIGHTTFYNSNFKVNQNVLIPRPETEELVEIIIKENSELNGIRILDIGTGSGCIPVTLAKNLNYAKVFAIDISEGALQTAKENAVANSTEVTFLKVDILNDPIPFELDKLDVIVSNPPYVTFSEKAVMKKNVLNYEPHTALFVPDDDALVFYNKILSDYTLRLKRGGKVYFEINENKGPEVEQLFKKNNFSNIQIRKDFNNKVRFAIGTL